MTHTLELPACPDRDTWSGFYAGMVDEDAVAGLGAHLDGCCPCQSILLALGDTTTDGTTTDGTTTDGTTTDGTTTDDDEDNSGSGG